MFPKLNKYGEMESNLTKLNLPQIVEQTIIETPIKQKIIPTTEKYLKIEQLPRRAILKIEGYDVIKFLQRLVINDLTRHSQLESLYVMFLNPKGRIIADGLLFGTLDPTVYLLEVDTAPTQLIEKHLNDHIYHQDVKVCNFETRFNVWQIFDVNANKSIPSSLLAINRPNSTILGSSFENILIFYEDPRHYKLGSRLLTSTEIGIHHIKQKVGKLETTTEAYKQLRYQLGIPEGSIELPSDKMYAVEANADYLQVLHFNKGEYIGADVTLDQYLKGNNRFRVAPMVFESGKKINVNDAIIKYTDDGKVIVGVVRGVSNNLGIGLISTDALYRNDLFVRGIKVTATKPNWWPLMQTKEVFKLN